jgi:RHS repeat-associated protein
MNAAGATIPKSTINQSLSFTGLYEDRETGLYYARNRMYSPTLGRFVNRDPIGYVNGTSLYGAYFVPNSLDPYGLYTIDIKCCCQIESAIKGFQSAVDFITEQIADGVSSLREHIQREHLLGFRTAGLAGVGAIGGGRPACIQEAINAIEKNKLITTARYIHNIVGGGFALISGTVLGGGSRGAQDFMTVYLAQELVAQKAVVGELKNILAACEEKFAGCCGQEWRDKNCNPPPLPVPPASCPAPSSPSSPSTSPSNP